MSRTVFDIQMEFAEIIGYKNHIIWDLLSPSQSHILKKKIKELVPDKELEELRSNLFQKVWDQRKYTNRNSLTSIFFVLVADEETRANALASQKFSCHPVFRTRKCVAKDDSTNCCMIFIDATGRVYKNWSDYVHGNVLPKGIMVAPKNGYYTFDENNRVNLDFYITPATRGYTQFLEGADITATVIGFVSACVLAGAVVSLPVAAPLIAGASGVSFVSGTYTSIRAGSNLYDRHMHDESISLNDRQACASWIRIASSGASMATAGVTRLFGRAISAGQEMSTIGTIAVRGMNISSILLSYSKTGYGIFDLIMRSVHGEKIDAMDVWNLAASLVVFTHSDNNYQLALKIVTGIISYRKCLIKRQRRMFHKMTKETRRIKGTNQGLIDIIRSADEIRGRQYLNDPYKNTNNKLYNMLSNIPKAPARKSLPKSVVVKCGELGDCTFQPVNNGDSMKDTVLQMYYDYTDQVFVLVIQLVNSYIENDIKLIEDRIGVKVPRELVMKRVKMFLNEYKNITLEFIKDKESDIMNNLTAFFLSEEALECIKASNNGYVDACFIFSNPEASNDSVASLMDANVQLPCGSVVPLKDFDSEFFQHILNVSSFKDIIMSMAEKFPEDIFRFMLDLTQKFILTELHSIQNRIRIPVATEEIVYRILSHCLENYKDFNYKLLSCKSAEILKTVKYHFLELNTNYAGNRTKCPNCSGYYSIRNI